jgi:hypothetical protein
MLYERRLKSLVDPCRAVDEPLQIQRELLRECRGLEG